MGSDTRLGVIAVWCAASIFALDQLRYHVAGNVLVQLAQRNANCQMRMLSVQNRLAGDANRHYSGFWALSRVAFEHMDHVHSTHGDQGLRTVLLLAA